MHIISVNKASTFITAVAILRQKAQQQQPSNRYTFDSIFDTAVSDKPQGKTTRDVLRYLGWQEREKGWLSGHPTRTGESEQILWHREKQLEALRAVNAAVMAFVRHAAAAAEGSAGAQQALTSAFLRALSLTGELPGSKHMREKIQASLRTELTALARTEQQRKFIKQLLHKAVLAYLDEQIDRIIDKYERYQAAAAADNKNAGEDGEDMSDFFNDEAADRS